MPESWDAYVRSLGKHKRVVVKSQRDFDEWAEGKAQFHVAESRESMAEGLRVLQTLHGQRWADEGETGAFHSPRFSRFHERVMPSMLQRGALDLRWLTVDGQPVSANYAIRWNGKVYHYQSGRRMNVPPQARVGIVLHAAGIRDAIAAGCREYDFLGGDAQYKRQLASGSRPIVCLRVVRAPLRERVRRSMEKGVALLRPVRAWLRKSPTK
jgi:CelD/BcsL family acetyltransferase involved in cellulose biosynthesis